jgi:hypothetical protein
VGSHSPFEGKNNSQLKVELAPTTKMFNDFQMECIMWCWKGFSKGYNFGTWMFLN